MRPAPCPPPVPPGPSGQTWRALMAPAFDEACAAAAENETPIGAVLVSADGAVIARAHNQVIALRDPTAHAEILCLRQAGAAIDNHRLGRSILLVTLEPCLMCVGALIHARVAGVVFAAPDPKAGALVSNLDGAALPFANHHMWTLSGVLAEDCSALLKRFFLARRK